MPKEYGVAQPWNFLCRKKGNFSAYRVGTEMQDQEKISKGNFEEVPLQTQRDAYQLKIRNLRKVYANGKVAVNDVSMTLYSG